MALTKSKKKTANKQENPVLKERLDHYAKGVEDMEMRKTRKGKGWDATIDAYMNKLPGNWPYTSKVTDPRIRTTILEKTARLLNSKLQGRLIPREGADIVKARINNTILDFQWDAATNGGSMLEKVALADMFARLFGAVFTLVYWDAERNTNEIKVLDPRDVFPDYTADHIRNAKWCQVREYTTLDELESRGFDIAHIRRRLRDKATVEREHLSVVKQNRGLDERLGMDPANPVVELVTEWTAKVGKKKPMRYIFLPRFNELLDESESPYKHGQIPVTMLRYYPLGDDMYGESEVEPVISLSRAINAVLCGFIDTMNLAMRPPIKLITGETRMETIEYGPGARWILNNIQSGQEVHIGETAIAAFNNTYPALVAAFNTAMGDQSLGVSNVVGRGNDPKTATEVNNLERQQNSRDQYNQLYLAQFLKEILMMWLSYNQQYLFDDPTKKFQIVRIVGREQIKELQRLALDELTLPDEAMAEISDMVVNHPGSVSPEHLSEIINDVSVPKNPVVTNPSDDPSEYNIVKKLTLKENGNEAELYVTPDDMEGSYDYIPDVKSMAAGAGRDLQEGRKQAFQLVLNDKVAQGLATEGQRLKMTELVTTILEDAGIRDAESLFEPVQAGSGFAGGGQQPLGAPGATGVPVPAGVPVPPSGFGMAGPQAVQTPGVPQPGLPEQVL